MIPGLGLPEGCARSCGSACYLRWWRLVRFDAESPQSALRYEGVETKTRKRWTSTKFRGVQLRTACDNAYNEKLSLDGPMTRGKFLQLIATGF